MYDYSYSSCPINIIINSTGGSKKIIIIIVAARVHACSRVKQVQSTLCHYANVQCDVDVTISVAEYYRLTGRSIAYMHGIRLQIESGGCVIMDVRMTV